VYQKFTALRTVLRKTGVLKVIIALLNIRKNISNKKYHKIYRNTRPKEHSISFKQANIKMNIIDEQHFVTLSTQYEKKIVDFIFDNCQSESIVWDIGANVGYYSIVCATAVGEKGKVYAFDPHPQAKQRILENAGLNNLENIIIIPYALGKEKSKLLLEMTGNISTGAHKIVSDEHKHEEKVVTEVSIVVGDDWAAENNVPIPTLVKIDVEGAEYDVLLGMKNTLKSDLCKAIVIEVHFTILAQNNKDEVPLKISGFLTECGFIYQRWLDVSHLSARKVV